MERALRLQADRMRVALEKTARQHSLQSSFRLSRGNVVAELLNAAGQADLMAMGIMGHMDITGRRLGSTARGVRAGSSCSLLLLANSLRRGCSVIVVYSGSPDSVRALSLAVELGEHLNTGLIVLLSAQDKAVKPLRAAAEERLADAGVPFVFEQIAADRFDELRLLIQRHEGSLLVIGQDCELATDHEDELGDLACPVLLARDGQDQVEPGGG
jgi:nucleotide-binding universal stress UspA family protein